MTKKEKKIVKVILGEIDKMVKAAEVELEIVDKHFSDLAECYKERIWGEILGLKRIKAFIKNYENNH